MKTLLTEINDLRNNYIRITEELRNIQPKANSDNMVYGSHNYIVSVSRIDEAICSFNSMIDDLEIIIMRHIN